MSVYLDTITLIWAIGVLIIFCQWAVFNPSKYSLLGLLATSLYLFAQTGWTVAFFSGDVWGRDFSNYLWFVFNTTVFAILTFLWYDHHKK